VRKLSEIREEEEKILKQEIEAIDKKKNMEARMQDYLSEEVHAARIQGKIDEHICLVLNHFESKRFEKSCCT
jgi:hypothetical protein